MTGRDLVGRTSQDGGLIAAVSMVVIALGCVIAVALAPPLQPETWSFDPARVWPWWPGPPGTTLLLFIGALLALGVAAFVRRARSGVSQALLGGSAANAGSSVLWWMIEPEQLAQPTPSWLAFVAAGMLSLVLWSSLIHLILVFPTRDRHVESRPWLVPLLYVVPQLLLVGGAWATGGLAPASLAWLDAWPRIHAAIVSLLLVLGLLGIAVRFRSVSVARRKQVTGIALSVAFAVLAALSLVDLPIVIGGAPLVERGLIVLLSLPVPVFLALALWQDRSFRLDRLRRSKMALLHAREEERRRLRRDLHDGLGPTLAAIGLKVESAASWVGRDQAEAERLLDEVRRDLAAAMADTRRLVRGLRPPALAELGLAGAIRHLSKELFADASAAPAISVEAGVLPELPAAVELAAYRIVQESITNAVRHSNAGHCDVRLAVDGDSLRIEVEDDGTGLPPDRHAGVGTEAMRERAEELGGEFWLDGSSGGGTRVLVTLPLAPA
jgi:signal transduction histidine kinase